MDALPWVDAEAFARRAIDMLIQGAPHSAVYSRLERMRRDLNRQRSELWEYTDL